MSVPERLRVMEQLWEALRQNEGELASPAWHGEVLSDRKARATQGEARFLTLDQLKARLRDSAS